MSRHFYFIVESDLDTPETLDLFALMEEIVVPEDPTNQPANMLHWRYRLDGQAGIFEALFDEAAVNSLAMRGRLTSVSKVTPNKIETSETVGAYGPQYAYTHKDTLELLMNYIVCGGDASDWETSRQAVLRYLFDNQTEWEEVEL